MNVRELVEQLAAEAKEAHKLIAGLQPGRTTEEEVEAALEVAERLKATRSGKAQQRTR